MDITARPSLAGARYLAGIQRYRGKVTTKHRAGIIYSNADGPSRDLLPNDRSNPAADLDPDQTIELGRIAMMPNTSTESPVHAFLERAEEEPEALIATTLPTESSCAFRSVQDQLNEPLRLEDSSNDSALLSRPQDEGADARAAAIAYSGLDVKVTTRLIKATKPHPLFKLVYDIVDKKISLVSQKAHLPPEIIRDLNQGRYCLLGGLLDRKSGLTSAVAILDPTI